MMGGYLLVMNYPFIINAEWIFHPFINTPIHWCGFWLYTKLSATVLTV